MAIRVQRTAIKAGRYEQTVIGTSSLLMLLSRSAVCGVCAVCRQQLGFFVLVLLQFDASLNRNLCCEALLSTGWGAAIVRFDDDDETPAAFKAQLARSAPVACRTPPPPLAWYSTRRSADYCARQDKTRQRVTLRQQLYRLGTNKFIYVRYITEIWGGIGRESHILRSLHLHLAPTMPSILYADSAQKTIFMAHQVAEVKTIYVQPDGQTHIKV